MENNKDYQTKSGSFKKFKARFNKLARSQKVSNPYGKRNFTPEVLGHKDRLIIAILLSEIDGLKEEISKLKQNG